MGQINKFPSQQTWTDGEILRVPAGSVQLLAWFCLHAQSLAHAQKLSIANANAVVVVVVVC